MAAYSEYPKKQSNSVIQVLPSDIYDIKYLSSRLRKADKQEIYAASGKSPFENLSRALYRGIITLTAFKEDRPVAVFGTSDVVEIDGETVAWIWMVGTDEITVNAKELFRVSRLWLPLICLKADAAMNNVDSRNKRHIAWLEHLGFSVNKEEPVFMHDPTVPFYPFTLELSNV